MKDDLEVDDIISFYKGKGWKVVRHEEVSYFRAIAKFILDRELGIELNCSFVRNLNLDPGCLFWDNIFKRIIMQASEIEEEAATKIYHTIYPKYYCRFVKLHFTDKQIKKSFLIETKNKDVFAVYRRNEMPSFDKMFFYVMRDGLDVSIIYYDEKD